MAESKKNYHQGHDIKSLLLNLALTLSFILPVAIYIKREFTKEFCMATAAAAFIATIAPPFGFYRPHPYTDWEGNTPFKLRRD
eukprot:CAMPEP_0197241028 /NCGR_PEP_ID=MMETSP1429-20130617/7174_1 /TAXON_ID=49237 /ORGANISM="Chaetoceros  sp., Strain UNC1202" /LENGTH=82 /DNA_ID=CAMNT_0042700789 /DNA_START=98 /DNA_END=346 /DNA_ORIENTATION=+